MCCTVCGKVHDLSASLEGVANLVGHGPIWSITTVVEVHVTGFDDLDVISSVSTCVGRVVSCVVRGVNMFDAVGSVDGCLDMDVSSCRSDLLSVCDVDEVTGRSTFVDGIFVDCTGWVGCVVVCVSTVVRDSTWQRMYGVCTDIRIKFCLVMDGDCPM